LGWSVIDVPLSVLDVAPVAAGRPAGEALAHTTALARRTEELGFRRFWVAEHHNMPAIASSAPAVLIAHLAAATSTIRVGSGGVMLPNHAPPVVAEQFGTLSALHPTPEEAAAHPYTDVERAFIADRQVGQAIGSVATVRAALEGLLAKTEADELMLTTMVYDVADRLRSFELARSLAP
jgi:alkanesulfonate monooxygenase SsuD/methylene tetrahydromethanopterin reductase-like flavin-dependent oxidoreductase (luciferase family)